MEEIDVIFTAIGNHYRNNKNCSIVSDWIMLIFEQKVPKIFFFDFKVSLHFSEVSESMFCCL